MRRWGWIAFFSAYTALGALFWFCGIDVDSLNAPRQAVTFEDRFGDGLGTVRASDARHAVAVPIGDISPLMIRAAIDTEDARYYLHGAVDLPALARALREYVVYGGSRSGGSTIAMQVARLLYPDDTANSREKLRQIVTAERLTWRSSKSAILEAYLNHMPLGGNVYGVEAAAQTYFGETASELDLAQASLLAGIPNDPSRLNPYHGMHALRERQRYVLQRMVACGDITPARAEAAFAESLHLRSQDQGAIQAPHVLYSIFSTVSPHTRRVRTTIDGELQRFAEAQTRAVLAAVSNHHVGDASVLVLDNRTGDVLAYVGSPDYFSSDALGANDGVRALRQPGSSLKPFTYELALERHDITTTTILPDVPSAFALPGNALYQPADYSGRFSGPVRARSALAASLNVPAVRVLAKTGVPALLRRLRELGFEHLDKPPEYYGLGLTLGGGEVSLWELVRAYSTMSRDGVDMAPHLVPAAEPARRTLVGDPNTWSYVTNVLADPYARAASFGIDSVLRMPFDAAVKTGTSSDFRDTWTVGYTRDYTVGVWVGNFDGSPMRGVSGVTGAAPLWNRIMLHLHERSEPAAFPAPRGYRAMTICAVTGHVPQSDCPASVREYVLPKDAPDVSRAVPATLDRRFDPWIAEAPPRTSRGRMHIVSPQNGSLYVYHRPENALQTREEQIALQAAGSQNVRWFANGEPLATDAEGRPFLRVRPGTYDIEARDGRQTDHIRIRVVAAPASLRSGFSRDR